MATAIADILDRVRSLCASEPFSLTEAVSPFDFSLQPTGQIDQVFRLTSESDAVIGGFNFTEDRTDRMEIWVARKQQQAPSVAYSLLLEDAEALRSAVIRDGATGGGDYTVPDGAGFSITHEDGVEFAVLRLTLPVNYEAEV